MMNNNVVFTKKYGFSDAGCGCCGGGLDASEIPAGMGVILEQAYDRAKERIQAAKGIKAPPAPEVSRVFISPVLI